MHLYRLFTTAAAAALATGALAGPALAATPPDASGNYTFSTLNNPADPTFNQLLGVNDSGLISGYYGSGEANHPNRGYLIAQPYGQGHYRNENFPGAAQTQVTGLNNVGTTVGFLVNAKGANSGFYARHGNFHKADFPTSNSASPRVDQLLGVNDHNVAVGFYTDGQGVNHGYAFNIKRHSYRSIAVSGDTNVTAAGINNAGDVAGFATTADGATEAFLKRADGTVAHLTFPGASSTQAFGVNNGDEVVGDYTVGSGDAATTHGFAWVPGLGFVNVDDPNGVGATTINGVNDHGKLVGFYTDSNGNTDGLVATPSL